ncbi:MAG: class I SAM-dependent methyltransferase [Leptolyngbyaceae cyanobacterium]
MLIETIKKRIYKEQFQPSWLGLIVNPFFFARKGLFFHIQNFSSEISGDVLDVGCGQKPYQGLFNTDSYFGLELDTPENREHKKADYFYDGERFPFPRESFDAVIINQVLEHVFKPERFLAEVHRILRLNGKLLITVPFCWDEHEQPNDYARYSSFGLIDLLERNGFEVIRHQKSIADIRAIFQMFGAYIFKVVNIKSSKLKVLVLMLLIGPINLIGQFLYLVTPRNEDFYLDNVVLSAKTVHKTDV